MPIVALLVLAACSTLGPRPPDAPADPPAIGTMPAPSTTDLQLSAPNFVANESAVLQVRGAPPSTAVTFVVGQAGLGAGLCPPALMGGCLSILSPVVGMPATVTTDSAGEATLAVTPPLGGAYVAFQAIVPSSSPPLLSNPVARLVAPSGTVITTGVDSDGDGYPADEDCADFHPGVHPGARDVLGDGRDMSCDDMDGVDADGDGFLAGAAPGLDCDDADPGTHPGQVEFCDHQDNDCDPTTRQETNSVFLPATGLPVDLGPFVDQGPTSPGSWTVTEPGVVTLCPGDHHAVITVAEVDVTVRGLSGGRAARLDGGGGAAIEVEPGLNGVAVNHLTLTGNDGAVRVGDGSDVELVDIEVVGATGVEGGAVRVGDGASLYLAAAQLSSCTADDGGAVWLGSAAALVIDTVRMEGNHSFGDGGAIAMHDGSSLDAFQLGLRDNAADGNGGGLAAQNIDRIDCVGCVVWGNRAAVGGGLFVVRAAAVSLAEAIGVPPPVVNWVIGYNVATSGSGGGAFFHAVDTLTMDGIPVVGNEALTVGGGLALDGVGHAELDDLEIAINYATSSGGGLWSSVSDLTYNGLWIEGNRAARGGGATFSDSTVAGDARYRLNLGVGPGSQGGALLIEGGTTTLWGVMDLNTAENGGAMWIGGGATVSLDSVVQFGNVADLDGGAIWMASSTVDMFEGVMQECTAQRGGALLVAAGGTLDVDRVSFYDGRAEAGSVWALDGGSVSFLGAGFHNNVATAIGGGGIGDISNGSVSFDRCDMGTPGNDDNTMPEVVTPSTSHSYSGLVSYVVCTAAGCVP